MYKVIVENFPCDTKVFSFVDELEKENKNLAIAYAERKKESLIFWGWNHLKVTVFDSLGNIIFEL